MPTVGAKEVARRAKIALSRLTDCDICPKECAVDRSQGVAGDCGIADKAVVASYGAHFGEERPLVGRGGSGTVFFSGCNLSCVFCQNHDISQEVRGQPRKDDELAAIFLMIQGIGCHNLNLVTPTHVVPQWLNALAMAMEQGFSLPLVYNSGGYDKVETLAVLEGVVDIYMPDFKYADRENSSRFSACPDYPEVAKAAILEMHRQVGDLRTDAMGVATGGLLLRHLVLPGGLAGTEEVLRFVAENLGANTTINVMSQYRPQYRAALHKELNRGLSAADMNDALAVAARLGLGRVKD